MRNEPRYLIQLLGFFFEHCRSGWVLCKREVCNFFPCCGPFAHILPPFRFSSRHYLRIFLSFCQVDGQLPTNLTDHHGHWQKREVCHFFLWWWVTVSHCGQFAAIQAANFSPFVMLTFRDVWRETPPSRRTVTPPWDSSRSWFAAKHRRFPLSPDIEIEIFVQILFLLNSKNSGNCVTLWCQ